MNGEKLAAILILICSVAVIFYIEYTDVNVAQENTASVLWHVDCTRVPDNEDIVVYVDGSVVYSCCNSGIGYSVSE